MRLGFIGLGKMGNRMVMKLLGEGHEVVVWNRTREKVDDLLSQKKSIWKLSSADSVESLVKGLSKPRIIWSMLPAGEATEQILVGEVARYVEQGDIVIDGANSRFSDTQRRYELFQKKRILFLGIGVSGGIIAFEKGYPMMVGGNKKAYETVKPILDSLAKPKGGYEYFGEGGAGHFVKMIHNAIEYGYMQAVGEGFGILANSKYNLDLVQVAQLYSKGTLISGFMMDRAVEALENDPKMETIEGIIGKASGETIWAVEEAEKNNLPIDVIKSSLEIRNESETNKQIQKSFAARLVSALRFAFGGHDVKKKS